jgi:Fe-S-cluster containining protein
MNTEEYNDIESFFSNLTESEQKRFSIVLNRCFMAYEASVDKKEALKDLYRITDSIIDSYPENAKKSITCNGKGCSFCCNISVMCSQLEAKLIADYCKRKNIKIDKERLKEQSKLSVEEYVLSKHKRCVFLSKENQCSIYPVRPFACRIHNSVSPVQNCDTDNNKGEKTTSYIQAESYAALFVLFSNGQSPNKFSKQLLKLI